MQNPLNEPAGISSLIGCDDTCPWQSHLWIKQRCLLRRHGHDLNVPLKSHSLEERFLMQLCGQGWPWGIRKMLPLRMGLSIPEPIDRYISELMCYGGSVSSFCFKRVMSLAHLVHQDLWGPLTSLVLQEDALQSLGSSSGMSVDFQPSVCTQIKLHSSYVSRSSL